jgi:hypothetical protein
MVSGGGTRSCQKRQRPIELVEPVAHLLTRARTRFSHASTLLRTTTNLSQLGTWRH